MTLYMGQWHIMKGIAFCLPLEVGYPAYGHEALPSWPAISKNRHQVRFLTRNGTGTLSILTSFFLDTTKE